MTINNQRNFKNNNNVQNNFQQQNGVLTIDGRVITPEKVQLISDSGENFGLITLEEAIKMSSDQGLDLVLISGEKVENPVVKIMNFSKRLYEEKKKKSISKKKTHEIQTKELRVSLKIGDHDLYNKCKKAVEFLKDGDRVKFVMLMKGREKSLKDVLGVKVFLKIINYLKENSEGGGKVLIIESESETFSSVLKIFVLKSNK